MSAPSFQDWMRNAQSGMEDVLATLLRKSVV